MKNEGAFILSLYVIEKFNIHQTVSSVGMNLPRKSELEVIVQVIQVDEEVPEVSAQATEKHPVSEILGESHKEHAHPFVELLVPKTEELHSCLAHLDYLTFREALVDDEPTVEK